MSLTQHDIKTRLDYDHNTGVFIWRDTGKTAGTSKDNGYIAIGFNGRYYYAHRLAFLYVTGALPEFVVDHIDGNRANNAWKNLRAVSQTDNLRNQHGPKGHNKLGVKGVHTLRNGKYRANITVNKRAINLGHFESLDDARSARRAAELKFFGNSSSV